MAGVVAVAARSHRNKDTAGSLAAGISAKQEQMLEPDVLTPEQFLALRVSQRRPPELRLRLAVLEDAMTSLVRHRAQHDSCADCRREHVWLFVSEDRTWPFSFLAICEALSLEPDYVRRGVRKLIEEITPRRGGTRA